MLAVLFGAALSLCGERAQPVTHLIDLVTEVLFKIIGFIVRLAPLGVFGAIAYTVGAYGVSSLQQLGMLVVLYYLTVIFFVVVILGGILRLAGFSIFKLLRYLREELMIVLGTASSDAVLPQIMRKLEHMGIKDSTVGLVIPTGYSFNLDAFSIYLTLATVFIAQATNTPLAFMDLLLILAVALLTSKGAHGIPGSAIVVLAATLSAVPVIPAIGLVLVLSVDWFMGMARALGNMTGNCVATVVIAAWEGDIDRERAHQVLNGEGRGPDRGRALRPRARGRTTPDADRSASERRRAALPRERGPDVCNRPRKAAQTLSSIQPLSDAFGAAPVRFEITSPPLNMNSAGMPRTPYWAGRFGFSSTFTLATISLPSYSSASSSSAGPIILHGPHHSAQKSTRTGTVASSTSPWNVLSVTLTVAIAGLHVIRSWKLT